MTKFYDSDKISGYPHGVSACFYGDGLFAVTDAEIRSVDPPRMRLITTSGNGHTCSIIDGHPDNPITPAQVRGFVRDRRAKQEHAIIYCPRSFVLEHQRALLDDGHGELLQYERLYWWIATLDGFNWTPAELSADIADNFDAMLSPDRIWAVQNNQIPHLGSGAVADESELFLAWRP